MDALEEVCKTGHFPFLTNVSTFEFAVDFFSKLKKSANRFAHANRDVPISADIWQDYLKFTFSEKKLNKAADLVTFLQQ